MGETNEREPNTVYHSHSERTGAEQELGAEIEGERGERERGYKQKERERERRETK